MKPTRLPANQFDRFYAGGATIRAFRNLPPLDEARPQAPEDWIASATTVFGDPALGLTRLPDGTYLRDALQADPDGWLGPVHVERFGSSPALLTKLLDAGERLPVHLHPDRAFAERTLDSPFGKTEAWLVLRVRGDDPRVWLGFRDDVERDQLVRWVDEQDTVALLDALRSVPVAPGDAVLVPAGLPHAIGDGVFLAELQEPTDYSILLEWEGFSIDGRRDGHLGLGFDVALDAVDRSGRSQADVDALRGPPSDGGTGLLPNAAEPFFRADRLEGPTAHRLPAGFAVVIGLDGEGTLVTQAGGELRLGAGDTVVVPYASGDFGVDGDVQALVCRPPDPQAVR